MPSDCSKRVKAWLKSVSQGASTSPAVSVRRDSCDIDCSNRPAKRHHSNKVPEPITFKHPFNAPQTPSPSLTMSGIYEFDRAASQVAEKAQTSKRARSQSPTKRSALDLFVKPVKIEPLDGFAIRDLPKDVRPLLDELEEIQGKEGLIPLEAREAVEVVDGICKDKHLRSQPTPDAEEMLEVMLDIYEEARCGLKEEYHESGWNHFVHTPLMKLVFPSRKPTSDHLAKYRQKRREYGGSSRSMGAHPEQRPKAPSTLGAPSHNMDTARSNSGFARLVSTFDTRILSANLPQRFTDQESAGLGAASEEARSMAASETSNTRSMATQVMRNNDTRRVDYAISLELPPESRLRRVMRGAAIAHAQELGLGQYCVNQTSNSSSLYEAPIAVSIETKIKTSSQDAMVQLGIWIASWHNKMKAYQRYMSRQLPNLRGSSSEQPNFMGQIPSALLVEIENHDFSLYFAVDRQDRICLYGPFKLGSTQSLTEMYALVAALQVIRDWVTTRFHDALEQWFQCDSTDHWMSSSAPP